MLILFLFYQIHILFKNYLKIHFGSDNSAKLSCKFDLF